MILRLSPFVLVGLITLQSWGTGDAPVDIPNERVVDENNLKLQPGEKVTITKRTVVRVMVPDKGVAPSRPSWRCKNISDEAYLQLSPEGISKSDWDSRAADFIVENAVNCPSYAALEKELPPLVNQKKYTRMLSTLYDLNRTLVVDGLVRIARESELDAHIASFKRKSQDRKTASFLESYQEKHSELERRVGAARLLIPRKFPDEAKRLTEAWTIVRKYVDNHVDKNGNVKNETFPALKSYVKSLTPDQRASVKSFVRNVLVRSEFPKLNLIASQQDEEAMEGKNSRSLASFVRKDTNRRAAMNFLLFALE